MPTNDPGTGPAVSGEGLQTQEYSGIRFHRHYRFQLPTRGMSGDLSAALAFIVDKNNFRFYSDERAGGLRLDDLCGFGDIIG